MEAKQGTSAAPAWEPPEIEVIPLDCEISAYAPAEDEPLL